MDSKNLAYALQMTGIQAYYHLDNCFARIIKRAIKKTEGNELDKRSKRSIIVVSSERKLSSGHQLYVQKRGINPILF